MSSSSTSTTSIHVTALDGIVNVNSLFTLGVFLGLSFNPSDPAADLAGHCSPRSNSIAEDMVTFHVLSFSSFLFSSLVALCLKQAVRIRCSRHNAPDYCFQEDVPPVMSNNHRPRNLQTMIKGHLPVKVFPSVHKMNKALLRMGILLSAVGSLSGCACLMMALVNVVQIKLGTLGCSGAAAAAVVPLVILVPLAMVVYVSIIFYAFTR